MNLPFDITLSLSFARPWILAFLVLPAMLFFWVWTRRGARLALPFDHQYGDPKKLPGRRARGRALGFFLKLAESVPALLAVIAILLLAGPQRVGAPKTKRKLTNIQFCVDVSGSMTASYGEGTRYDAAMEAINGFLDFREGDAFGLTFFGNNVLHWVPLTSDTSAFRCAPPFMDPKRGTMPPWFGGTAIGKALKACRDVLITREEGDRMIILISDGQSPDLYGGQDQEIADMMREAGISVYGIHVASGGIPGEVVNIASISGGEVFEAGDPVALETVFKRIDEMQVAELEKVAGEQLDAFGPWCWLGLGALGLFALFGFFLRATPW
ncbi:von Willebrand factor type A domain protein [Planctomycetes bacterium Poly30]|uniref:von Willebrand factor type A domain protein n=1 Tax=Saltatorellus ferox TaxID=2528018 RepID=A0A518F0B0_9BACT|nr:von Willebrand factor type A domain protein [Planctomycetes bacterium Poly30]